MFRPRAVDSDSPFWTSSATRSSIAPSRLSSWSRAIERSDRTSGSPALDHGRELAREQRDRDRLDRGAPPVDRARACRCELSADRRDAARRAALDRRPGSACEFSRMRSTSSSEAATSIPSWARPLHVARSVEVAGHQECGPPAWPTGLHRWWSDPSSTFRMPLLRRVDKPFGHRPLLDLILVERRPAPCGGRAASARAPRTPRRGRCSRSACRRGSPGRARACRPCSSGASSPSARQRLAARRVHGLLAAVADPAHQALRHHQRDRGAHQVARNAHVDQTRHRAGRRRSRARSRARGGRSARSSPRCRRSRRRGSRRP